MKDKNQTQVNNIEICSVEAIIEKINNDKELAEKDITKFCRDRAIELLHGYQIDGEKLIVVNTERTLDILRFLALLNRG